MYSYVYVYTEWNFYIHRQIMFEGSTHLSRIGDPIVFSCIKH